MFVGDVCIPHSWYTIEYYNENLYFRFLSGSGYQDYIVQLSQKNYDISTLAETLKTAMNTAVNGLQFESREDVTTRLIQIRATYTEKAFYIFSDRTLQIKWTTLGTDLLTPPATPCLATPSSITHGTLGSLIPWTIRGRAALWTLFPSITSTSAPPILVTTPWDQGVRRTS
jgi:hypothetical protein